MADTKLTVVLFCCLTGLFLCLVSCQPQVRTLSNSVEPQSQYLKSDLEFSGLGPWLNSDPFTLYEQRGKAVLIDFWRYTCVNCIRTLPYLKEWHKNYSDHGLVIVGVHTPEFAFEKIFENVDTAVSDFGIEYAVAQDNDYQTWKVFDNRYWPAKYLLDKDGVIQYQHFGEGGYMETESAIRALLDEAGFDIEDIPRQSQLLVEDNLIEVENRDQTRELYAGTSRNYKTNFFYPPYVGNEEYFSDFRSSSWEKEISFEDPDDRDEGRFYINGLWNREKEYLQHARETSDYSDYIAFYFSASEVNGVFGFEKKPYKVLVTLDGKAMDSTEAGVDVRFSSEGDSFLIVDRSAMFGLVQLKHYQTRELKLKSNSIDFSIYSFTFGSNNKPD